MLVDVEGEDGGGGEFEGTNIVTVMSYRLCVEAREVMKAYT